MTRAEWLLVKRLRADVLRVPIFLLVFIVCGEFTPLVAIFFSSAVPRSLWIPKQVQQAREKLEARRREVFRNPPTGLNLDTKTKDAPSLPRAEVVHIGRSLGLYSSIWDRINAPPIWLIQRRIKKRMASVELDDLTINRDGGVEKMENPEIELAVETRGIDVIGRKESDLRSDLSSWLLNRKALAKQGLPTRRLYLTRPSAWPYQRPRNE